MQRILPPAIILAAAGAVIAAEAPHVCGGSETIVVESAVAPGRAGGPFDIVMHFDAVIEGQANEPFTIEAGVNDQLRMRINGGSAFTITLQDSANYDATRIAQLINANTDFRPVADAFQSARAGTLAGDGMLNLRSQGAVSGTIELLPVANDAYTTLGLDLFVDSLVTTSVLPAEQAVLEQAAQDWEAVITDPGSSANPYVMRSAFFEFAPGTSVLANATVIENGSGELLLGRSQFNRDVNYFVDPTPGSDEEFLPDGTGGPLQTDLLSVARHEFGHALGISSGGSRYFQYLSADSATFDADRLNVATTPGSAHTDPAFHPGDLMQPSIGWGRRRGISIYPVASMLSRMHFYTVPMNYVDDNSIWPAGTATDPYILPSGVEPNEPAGEPTLMIRGEYPGTYFLSEPRIWSAARGGSAEIGAP